MLYMHVLPPYCAMEEMISTTRSTSRSWSTIGMIPVRKLSLVFLLCLYAIIIATGQTLFDALSTVLSERGIPWSNVVGFYSDSASVMVGRRNSVLSRVLISVLVAFAILLLYVQQLD